MDIRSLRGMHDMLPDDARIWQAIEERARKVLKTFGYKEIRTPVMEETALFIKSIGETTDIVQKEMYSFQDQGGRNVSLRPEGTAPIVRSFIEHGLDKKMGFAKVYYMGPMFRAERPQAARLRQFHQIGVEAIGSGSPYVDAENIIMLGKILDALGVEGYIVKLNTLGCLKDKADYAKVLKDFFSSRVNRLCEDCKKRVERNPFRVLDCKNEACRSVARESPAVSEHICGDCSGHFSGLRNILDSLNVKYLLDPHLVRGLDYYTKTTFEVTSKKLGSQDAIGAGGRYDTLFKSLGGPDLAACGFALGVERVIQALDAGTPDKKTPLDLYVATIGKEAYQKGFELLCGLRDAGIDADIEFGDKSLKAQMRQADRKGAKFVVLLGDDELKSGKIVLRNMSDQTQKDLEMKNAVQQIKEQLNRQC